MADTLGSLIDKLNTISLKMWNAQEDLYEVRRMTFEEFKEKYGTDEGLKNMYNIFKKACDLNIQRNDIIYEIDREMENICQLDRGYAKDPHKTY